ETATRAVASWAAEQLTPAPASELVARLRALLVAQPAAPTLAAALRIARDNGWDGRVVQAIVLALADAIERPAVRATVAEVIDELLTRYRARMGVYPRLWIGLAELLGVLDRERIVTALHAALRAQVGDWLKARVSELVLRHHGRIAEFIANGVRALGPEGVVRLIDEHAGDDLQYIRVNGTVVGGLAGGAIYGVHLLVRLL